jgi:hypothetical protein
VLAKRLCRHEDQLPPRQTTGRAFSPKNECLERRYAQQSQGYDFQAFLRRVKDIFGLNPAMVLSAGKQTVRVEARSVACYWAVRELGMTTVEV